MTRHWPRPHEVVVRFVRTGSYEDPVSAPEARQLLDAVERNQLNKIRHSSARRDYLAAHTLARTTLAEFLGCQPDEISFGYSAHGRPELVSPKGAERLSFSIAHTHGMALCAFTTDGTVGADVECLRNIGTDVLAVAEIVCSKRELEELRALPEARRAEHFLKLWTLKEAMAKGTGHGLWLPFTGITIQWQDGGPHGVEFAPEIMGDASRWRFALRCLASGHVIAAATCNKPGRDLAFSFEPGNLVPVGRVSVLTI